MHVSSQQRFAEFERIVTENCKEKILPDGTHLDKKIISIVKKYIEGQETISLSSSLTLINPYTSILNKQEIDNIKHALQRIFENNSKNIFATFSAMTENRISQEEFFLDIENFFLKTPPENAEQQNLILQNLTTFINTIRFDKQAHTALLQCAETIIKKTPHLEKNTLKKFLQALFDTYNSNMEYPEQLNLLQMIEGSCPQNKERHAHLQAITTNRSPLKPFINAFWQQMVSALTASSIEISAPISAEPPLVQKTTFDVLNTAIEQSQTIWSLKELEKFWAQVEEKLQSMQSNPQENPFIPSAKAFCQSCQKFSSAYLHAHENSPFPSKENDLKVIFKSLFLFIRTASSHIQREDFQKTTQTATQTVENLLCHIKTFSSVILPMCGDDTFVFYSYLKFLAPDPKAAEHLLQLLSFTPENQEIVFTLIETTDSPQSIIRCIECIAKNGSSKEFFSASHNYPILSCPPENLEDLTYTINRILENIPKIALPYLSKERLAARLHAHMDICYLLLDQYSTKTDLPFELTAIRLQTLRTGILQITHLYETILSKELVSTEQPSKKNPQLLFFRAIDRKSFSGLRPQDSFTKKHPLLIKLISSAPTMTIEEMNGFLLCISKLTNFPENLLPNRETDIPGKKKLLEKITEYTSKKLTKYLPQGSTMVAPLTTYIIQSLEKEFPPYEQYEDVYKLPEKYHSEFIFFLNKWQKITNDPSSILFARQVIDRVLSSIDAGILTEKQANMMLQQYLFNIMKMSCLSQFEPLISTFESLNQKISTLTSQDISTRYIEIDYLFWLNSQSTPFLKLCLENWNKLQHNVKELYTYMHSHEQADIHLFLTVFEKIPDVQNFQIPFMTMDWFLFFHEHPDILTTIFHSPNFQAYCKIIKKPPQWLCELLANHESSIILNDLLQQFPFPVSDFPFEKTSAYLLSKPRIKRPALSLLEFNTILPPLNYQTLLSSQQLLNLIRALPFEHIPMHAYYLLENKNLLPWFIKTSPSLSFIPIEPLIRFLQTKPLQKAFAFLSEKAPFGTVSRSKTLTFDQKITILQRFKDPDKQIPLPECRALFPEISDEQIKQLVPYQLIPNNPDDDEFHARLQEQMDPHDPTSLFLSLLQEYTRINNEFVCLSDIFQTIIATLLLRAQEKSRCGTRIFVTWGNQTSMTPCASMETLPIQARTKDGLVPIFTQGIFNDISESFPTLALRRVLLQNLPTLIEPLKHSSRTIIQTKCPVVWFEISRLAEHLAAKYSSLHIHMSPDFGFELDSNRDEEAIPLIDLWIETEDQQDDVDASDDSDSDDEVDSPPERQPERAATPQTGLPEIQQPDHSSREETTESIAATSLSSSYLIKVSLQKLHETSIKPNHPPLSTFKDSVASMYLALTRDPVFSKDFNNTFENQAAYLLMSIILTLRTSSIEKSTPNRLTIEINPTTSYQIRHIDVEEKAADNPWITPQFFHETCHDFPSCTATPFTPNKRTHLSHIIHLIEELKAIEPSDFYTKCADLFIKLHAYEDEEMMMLIDPLIQIVHASINLSDDALMSLHELTTYYMTIIPTTAKPLAKNSTYFVTSRINQFISDEKVPPFLRSAGNFASALCTQFTPIEPISHDGNCAVEAMLIGNLGKQYDRGEQGPLRVDIKAFRTQVVEYAKQHKEMLVQFCGSEKEVSMFIEGYAGSSLDMYSSDIAFICAARIFNRPIHIYSQLRSFKTDAQANVLPTQVFLPEGDSSQPPLHLVHFGDVHYAFLKPVENK